MHQILWKSVSRWRYNKQPYISANNSTVPCIGVLNVKTDYILWTLTGSSLKNNNNHSKKCIFSLSSRPSQPHPVRSGTKSLKAAEHQRNTSAVIKTWAYIPRRSGNQVTEISICLKSSCSAFNVFREVNGALISFSAITQELYFHIKQLLCNSVFL